MKLDITDENVIEQLGFPFYYWVYYGRFTITKQDLEYLEKIKNHPCFPIISEASRSLASTLDWANTRINEIVFYELFYKDSNCPHGVKNILFAIIGLNRGNLEEINMLNLLDYRYHSVELWINSVTQKSSP